MPEDESDKGPIAGKRQFATTHWSGGGDARHEDARDALSQLDLNWGQIWFTRLSGGCSMTGQSGTENTGDEDGAAVAD